MEEEVSEEAFIKDLSLHFPRLLAPIVPRLVCPYMYTVIPTIITIHVAYHCPLMLESSLVHVETRNFIVQVALMSNERL